MRIEIGELREPRADDADHVIQFFRLMAKLDLVLESGSKSPFYDAAAIIHPEGGDDDFDWLLESARFEELSLPAQRVCRWHVRFEMLPQETLAGLPITGSPFQPLISLLRSGGRLG
jgi:hypothetical protein